MKGFAFNVFAIGVALAVAGCSGTGVLEVGGPDAAAPDGGGSPGARDAEAVPGLDASETRPDAALLAPDASSAGADAAVDASVSAPDASAAGPDASAAAPDASVPAADAGDPGALIDDARRTTWRPGIPGGIPAVASTAANTITVTPAWAAGQGVAAFGTDGSGDAAPAINRALVQAAQAAGPGNWRIVFLPAGEYRTLSAIDLFGSYVILRGAGPGLTKIRKDAYGGSTIRISVNGFWPAYEGPWNVTADAPKGSRQLVLDDASQIQPGQVIALDQEDVYQPQGYNFIQGGYTYQKRQTSADYAGPARGAVLRSTGQVVEVESKSGNTLTLSGPLHVAFTAARHPQVWRTTLERPAWSGVEDLAYTGCGNPTIQNGSPVQGGDGQPGIFVLNADYCWLKNLEMDGRWVAPATPWTTGAGLTGIAVSIEESFHCEVRHSYVHHARWINNGGIAYGLSLSTFTTDTLVEDNIFVHLNKPLLTRNSGGGNVFGYNYVDEAYMTSPNWFETAADGTHQTFTHMDLWEGNWAANIGSDSTHGNSGWLTWFRNYAPGANGTMDYAPRRAVGLGCYSWQHNYLGNVLLSPTTAVGAVYDSVSNATLYSTAVWRIGNDLNGASDQWDDGTAMRETLRHGNFDYVSDEVVWSPSIAARALPASLYLDARPAFFGAHEWPWVEPTGATHAERVKTLPAKARYEAGTPNG